MSQENVEVVRSAHEAFNRDGAIDEYWTDDVDYRVPVKGVVDDRGPIHGKDALRAYVQDWSDTFEDFKIEPVELIDAGEDKVIAVLRTSGQAKLSGVDTDLTYAVVYTIRDGKISRGREYWNRAEALDAAGLSE
jgi:ketosteroid isomerase-like protein